MTKFTRPVTPAELSRHLRALCEQLAPQHEPIYVNAEPNNDAPRNECFPIVNQLVETSGGQAVVGWSLWELPTVFVEAEFHCVWQKSDGSLLDVTAKSAPCTRILFLPDSRRQYEGKQVNNVRRPIRDDIALRTYLATFDAEFELMNRGERAEQHGEITLTGNEAMEYQEIIAHRRKAFVELLPGFPETGPYHPCPCGSGKKMKWCHT
jgi:hypothetical protein